MEDWKHELLIFSFKQIVEELKTNFEYCSFSITLQENAKSIGKVLNCSENRYKCTLGESIIIGLALLTGE